MSAIRDKGRGVGVSPEGKTKQRFLSGIARITETPPSPLPPIRATWSSFFGRQKRRFARMTEFFLKMIMMVAMIKMMIIMMVMTKMTKRHAITVKFE